MSKSKVYFTKEITPENVVKLYEHLGVKLPGKVAVKVHSGEEGNQNYTLCKYAKSGRQRLSKYPPAAFSILTFIFF